MLPFLAHVGRLGLSTATDDAMIDPASSIEGTCVSGEDVCECVHYHFNVAHFIDTNGIFLEEFQNPLSIAGFRLKLAPTSFISRPVLSG